MDRIAVNNPIKDLRRFRTVLTVLFEEGFGFVISAGLAAWFFLLVARRPRF